ncbi:MAG: hypothetical protein JWP01_288 [Myxococcales bacterium]|nr:hypothetical protein [Myxococcales bacterium]
MDSAGAIDHELWQSRLSRFGRVLAIISLIYLAKRPEDRPASAHVLRELLRACVASGRWTNARAAHWWKLNRHELRSGGAGTSATGEALVGNLTVSRIAD